MRSLSKNSCVPGCSDAGFPYVPSKPEVGSSVSSFARIAFRGASLGDSGSRFSSIARRRSWTRAFASSSVR